MSRILKFIPHLRHVDDLPFEEVDSEVADADSLKAGERDQPLIEYRDEAGRPWWKFFDEYEYRLNKYETARHKWWYWFDEGTSKAEKKLIWKLDLIIAFYVFVVYWCKALDQSNIANAYVSNMKQDLGMKGNDYINAVTCYNVASVVFQLPAMYLFPRIPLHLFFPIIDFCWGMFTLFSYKVTTTGQIQAMRFFVGAFEASFYPAVHYILGSWYLPAELGRRGMLYYFGQMIGTISSGLLQGAVFNNLNGRNGLAGWRWMFIIDAVITLPVAVIGFFCVPGTPYKCYSLWLTDDEIRLARRRLERANITPPPAHPPNFFDKKLWKKVLFDWKVYVLTFFSIGCWNNSSTAGSGYILWLKSLGRYSIGEVNQLSCIAPGIGFALIAIVCGGADIFRCRFGAIAFSQVLNFISNIILLIWDVPESAKWFAFCILYAGWSQASTMYAWCNDILRRDPQERAITFIFLYMISQSTSIWITRLVWPTVDAPRFTVGYATTMAFAIYLFIFCFIVLYFYKRDEKKFAAENGIILYNSQTGEIPDAVRAKEAADYEASQGETASHLDEKSVTPEVGVELETSGSKSNS